MRLTKASIWAFSAASFFVGSSFSHYRFRLYALNALIHLPVLTWGIASIRSQFFGRVYFRAPGEMHRISVTFDDGPDPSLTPFVLDLLAKHEISATFFAIGEKCRRNGSILRRAVDEGHLVGCHDWDHSPLSNFRLRKKMTEDISRANLVIADAIGRNPALYRPPVGLTNPHTHLALRKLGLHCIGWSASARDAGNRFPGRISRISSLGNAGDVILLHDCLPRPEYRQAFLTNLSSLLDRLKRHKLKSVNVGAMFNLPSYQEPLHQGVS